jgi:hypothetical protein
MPRKHPQSMDEDPEDGKLKFVSEGGLRR